MRKKHMFLLSLLILSLLINASLVGYYYLKLVPEQIRTAAQLTSAKNEGAKAGCQRVYSLSQQKVIEKCNTRSEALSDCSVNFRKIIADIGSKNSGELDLSILEKNRDFAMKMCMEERGYEY